MKATIISGKIPRGFIETFKSETRQLKYSDDDFDLGNPIFKGICLHCKKDTIFLNYKASDMNIKDWFKAQSNKKGIFGAVLEMGWDIVKKEKGEPRICPSCNKYVFICSKCLEILPCGNFVDRITCKSCRTVY